MQKAPSKSNLLIVQIDGLSRKQFERAVDSGRMPFLKNLVRSKSHTLLSFYPGLPSCTPAVQAELFYGVKCATPAFSFYDRESQQEVRMYDAEWARRISEDARRQDDGLLSGGSSYANIYRGDAEKAKYCGELNTAEHWLKELSLIRLARLTLRYPADALRMIKLLGLELGLGIYDALKGITKYGDILQELKFIPARLAVAIALREAIRREVQKDIAADLPIIHANFFGYDEAAHRRGPGSRFAHWSLKGVDQTIRKLVRSAEAKASKAYEVIVFSDHGQEATRPYERETGETLALATQRLIDESESYELSSESFLASFMERSKFTPFQSPGKKNSNGVPKNRIRIQSMGPVAHIYFEEGLPDATKEAWARRYNSEASVPFILFHTRDGHLKVFTDGELMDLDALRETLLSCNHPFAEQTIIDLDTLARSKYAGDLVLLGWRAEGMPLSFADERGAHAGPGPQECEGFAIIPSKSRPLATSIRPIELRNISLGILGRCPVDTKGTSSPRSPRLHSTATTVEYSQSAT